MWRWWAAPAPQWELAGSCRVSCLAGWRMLLLGLCMLVRVAGPRGQPQPGCMLLASAAVCAWLAWNVPGSEAGCELAAPQVCNCALQAEAWDS